MEKHEMERKMLFPSGYELWVCPVCRRRVLKRDDANFIPVITLSGDDSAVHIYAGEKTTVLSVALGKTDPALVHTLLTMHDQLMPEELALDLFREAGVEVKLGNGNIP